MTDALNAEPVGPQTDTLAEQVELPKPQENLIPEADEPKSPDAKRSDSVRKAIDEALDEPKDAKKSDDDPKVEDKPAKKAKAEPKPEAKGDDAPEDADKAPAVSDSEPSDDEPDDTDTPKKATAYKEPPSGFDEAAKKEWEAVPEGVRGAVHRRVQELESGIHKHKQDAEQFEGVRQYAEMAKQSGTDLPAALGRYTQMEQLLRQNPLQGLQMVVANLDLKKADGTPVTLQDVAANIMGQSPDQAASQQEATINQLTQQVQSLTQQLGGFSKHVEQQQEQQKVTAAESEWATFQRDHPRAAELEKDMAQALQMQNPDAYPSLTERMRHAYAVAESLNPTVAHTDTPPLAQTQPKPKVANPAGQKSISGAPSGSDATQSTRKLSRRDSIEKGMRAAGI